MEIKAKDKKVTKSVRFEGWHFRWGGQGWLSWGDFGVRKSRSGYVGEGISNIWKSQDLGKNMREKAYRLFIHSSHGLFVV